MPSSTHSMQRILLSVSALFAFSWTQGHPLAWAQQAPIDSRTSDSRKLIKLQDARATLISNSGKRQHYDQRFDLSLLPHYVPQEQVSGKLRIWGNNYLQDGSLGEYWLQGFKKFQPAVEIDYYLPTVVVALPGLYTHQADLAMNHTPGFYDRLAYERVMNRDPLELIAVTGSYDVPGWMNSIAVLVNSANPLTRLTMKQLDGIFGSERTGGFKGNVWHREFSRGPEANIREWGKVGLKGKWARHPINLYSIALSNNSATDFSDRVLQGSDKWNEHIHTYSNYLKADNTMYLGADQITDALAKDPYGIAYVNFGGDVAGTKRLDIGLDDGRYIPHTLETVHDRTYPFTEDMNFYVDKDPAKGIDAKTKEFLMYVLSLEGQDEVQRDGKYLPLTKSVVEEQRRKLLEP